MKNIAVGFFKKILKRRKDPSLTLRMTN